MVAPGTLPVNVNAHAWNCLHIRDGDMRSRHRNAVAAFNERVFIASTVISIPMPRFPVLMQQCRPAIRCNVRICLVNVLGPAAVKRGDDDSLRREKLNQM